MKDNNRSSVLIGQDVHTLLSRIDNLDLSNDFVLWDYLYHSKGYVPNISRPHKYYIPHLTPSRYLTVSTELQFFRSHAFMDVKGAQCRIRLAERYQASVPLQEFIECEHAKGLTLVRNREILDQLKPTLVGMVERFATDYTEGLRAYERFFQ